MSHQNLNPPRVKELVDSSEGWIFVDVRTVEEFDAGHVTGACNVPFASHGPGGMVPNPDFIGAMKRLFPRDKPLVLG